VTGCLAHLNTCPSRLARSHPSILDIQLPRSLLAHGLLLPCPSHPSILCMNLPQTLPSGPQPRFSAFRRATRNLPARLLTGLAMLPAPCTLHSKGMWALVSLTPCPAIPYSASPPCPPPLLLAHLACPSCLATPTPRSQLCSSQPTALMNLPACHAAVPSPLAAGRHSFYEYPQHTKHTDSAGQASTTLPHCNRTARSHEDKQCTPAGVRDGHCVWLACLTIDPGAALH
jgi:hypothetical protein